MEPRQIQKASLSHLVHEADDEVLRIPRALRDPLLQRAVEAAAVRKPGRGRVADGQDIEVGFAKAASPAGRV